MSLKLHQETQKIDNVFSLADQVDYDDDYDDEVVSHLARYLCVLTSGLLEECVRNMLTRYVQYHSKPTVARFAQQRIGRITNLNAERLAQLVGSLNSEWRDGFERRTTDEQRDAINSVTANRHNIVHGRAVGITITQIRSYYKCIVEILELLEAEYFPV